MKKHSTKKALLLSVFSLVICFSMLIGTTFAWFTDSVTSANNIIMAGNLDIELEYSHDGTTWKTVKNSSELFDKNALWEPGHTEVVYLRLSNLGSLALRYDLGINIASETPGVNAAGDAFRLSNFINMAVISRDVNDLKFNDREEALEAANSQLDGELELVSSMLINDYNVSGTMSANADDIYLAVVVYMPTTVGNEANHNGTDIPMIELGITAFATQMTEESDSFGIDYDADAAPVINATYDWYVEGLDTGNFTINTASDLAGLANIVNGTATQNAVSGVSTYDVATQYVQDSFYQKTVTLGADIDLMNAVWTPIGNASYSFQGTFDGNDKTISNLYIPGFKDYVGLFGFTTNGEVKNLTVKNAIVFGRVGVGVVAGSPYTTKYKNITVTGHVEVNGLTYVGGVGGRNVYADWDKITVNVDETSYVKANSVEKAAAYRTYVGGVIGFMGEGGHTVSNVTSNIDVYGTSCDIGGITGIAHYGNTFKNVICYGDVTITNALEAADSEEIGGIAGVWHNDGNVTFNDCVFFGKLNSNITDDALDLSDNLITGKAYSATGKGKLIITGNADAYIGQTKYDTATEAIEAAEGGDTIILTAGTFNEVLDLKEKSLTVCGMGKNATVISGPETYTTSAFPMQTWAGWSNGEDSNVYALISANNDVTIKNLTVTGRPTEISEVAQFRHESNYAFVGIHVQNANAVIDSVDINGIKPATVTGNDHHNFGLYITTANDTASHTVSYTNGTVSDVNRGGIYCWSGNYKLNFKDVKVVGPGSPTEPNNTLTPAEGSENNKAIYAFCSFYVCSPATYQNVTITDAWCVSWWGGASWNWADAAWSTNPPTGVTCINCGTDN